MPRYTFQVGNARAVCELSDIDLPDNDAAREYAIVFVSELFRSHSEIYSEEWHLCSLQVLGGDETEIFATTVPEAAMMERDSLRLQRHAPVNH
jgi:hypothetical protein